MSKSPNTSTRPTEADLAQDKMGANSLQGDDQGNVHTQRQAQAGVKKTPDGSVVESLKKMDKDIRAEKDLGKGAGEPD
ncbi:hypothetical protein LL06_00500 [Hoeflea sp. BAL378]|uniref:hypothetical protein n=1 Tax=Hoeflea sp. BAL378 TaxID=1547437 RepID=UPI000514083A|nr:hypothetical protein [Hoeflea sp. BAL378]KGF71309.1 hypothetical protein LL06_00500 [Hoeflea sp. BAL378]